MKALIAVSNAIDRFISRIGKLSAWLLLPLMAVIIFDVVTRKFRLLTDLREYFVTHDMAAGADFIGSYLTSTKFQEMEWHLHAALFLLCLGYGYVRNSHVRIEIVRERFSTRVKAWLEITGIVMFLVPYAALVLYFGWDFTQRSFAVNEVSAALTGLSHRYIIKAFVPLGMVLLLIAALGVLLRNVVYLFGSEQLSHDAYDHAMELHSPEEELRKLQRAAAAGEQTPENVGAIISH